MSNPNHPTPLLRVNSMVVHYGIVPALKNISFDVPQGKILTIIGANGAGKTTTLRGISGLTPLSEGSIEFQGKEITNLPPHQRVSQGISHVPEGRGVFLNLTVSENLDLGAWTQGKSQNLTEDLDRVYDLFPRLAERRKQNAGTLSGGEQQMLAIGRALMAHPKVLLLDEPSLGLAPQIIEKIFELIQKLNQDGMTFILVEQNALQALQIAHLGLVLETGSIALHGEARFLLRSDQVKKAYLGEYLE